MSDIDVSNSNSVDTNSAVSSTNTKKNKDGDNINNKKKNKEKKNEKDENIVWGAEHEKILVEWADKAMCYHWLHSKSNQKYSYINLWFTIPVIIISTVTGTLNFAQEKFPADYRSWVSTGIGSLNIIAGIITTIHQYFKYVELNESHRVSSVGWSKFYRNIRVELARRPIERMNVSKMLRINKEEYDRLMETSPDIPNDIIQNFKHEFMSEEYKQCCTSCKTLCDKMCCVKRQENTEEYKERLKNIKALRERIYKPEVCDVLISTEDQKYKMVEGVDFITTEGMIEMIQREKDENPQYEFEMNKVDKFKKKFLSVKGREPTEQEVIENLEDDVDPIIIRKILHGEINAEGQVDIENIMARLRDRNAMTSLVQNVKNEKSITQSLPNSNNVSPSISPTMDLELGLGLPKVTDEKTKKKNKKNKKSEQEKTINEIITVNNTKRSNAKSK